MAPPNTAQPLLVHTPKYVYTHKEYYFHTSQMKTKLNVSYVTLDLIGLHELLTASACVCEWMYSEALSECESYILMWMYETDSHWGGCLYLCHIVVSHD